MPWSGSDSGREDIDSVAIRNPPIVDSASPAPWLPVRIDGWAVNCCTPLGVGHQWSGILAVHGTANELPPVAPGDERWLVEHDDTALIVGNVVEVLERNKRHSVALVQAAGLRVLVENSPKRGGVAIAGRIWQEAHSESIDGDLDDEKWDSIQNHGVIRAIEQIDNIARDANELLLVTTEGRRATRESTAEMRGGSWRARFAVELRQPD